MTAEYITIQRPVKLFGFVLFWRTVYVPTTNSLMKRIMGAE